MLHRELGMREVISTILTARVEKLSKKLGDSSSYNKESKVLICLLLPSKLP